MIIMTFMSPHTEGMTKEMLIGKPLCKGGMEIGKITDAKLSGLLELKWEITAEMFVDVNPPISRMSVSINVATKESNAQ